MLWNRLSGLRVASFVGYVSVGLGLAPLILGLADGAPDTFARYFTLLGLAIGCLTHPLAGRSSRPALPGFAERHTVMALALGALTAAVSLGFAGSVSEDTTYSTVIPLVAATLVALAVEALYRRQRSSSSRIPFLVATFAAGGVAALCAVMPLGYALVGVLEAVAPSAGAGRLARPAAMAGDINEVLSVIALAVAVALVAAAWSAQGILRPLSIVGRSRRAFGGEAHRHRRCVVGTGDCMLIGERLL
jgi:hypothetical protein